MTITLNRFNVLYFIFNVNMIIFISCNAKDEGTSLYGTYKLQLEDSLKNPYFLNQMAIIKINDDNTIGYQTKVNGKMMFDVEGTYIYDRNTNTFTINWNQGKLPNKLVVERSGSNHTIRIGNTVYKKLG